MTGRFHKCIARPEAFFVFCAWLLWGLFPFGPSGILPNLIKFPLPLAPPQGLIILAALPSRIGQCYWLVRLILSNNSISGTGHSASEDRETWP